MRPTREDEDLRESAKFYISKASSLNLTCRTQIATSAEFRTLVLKLAKDGISEMKPLLQQGLEEYAQTKQRVADEADAERKRKQLEQTLTPVKKARLAHSQGRTNSEPAGREDTPLAAFPVPNKLPHQSQAEAAVSSQRSSELRSPMQRDSTVNAQSPFPRSGSPDSLYVNDERDSQSPRPPTTNISSNISVSPISESTVRAKEPHYTKRKSDYDDPWTGYDPTMDDASSDGSSFIANVVDGTGTSSTTKNNDVEGLHESDHDPLFVGPSALSRVASPALVVDPRKQTELGIIRGQPSILDPIKAISLRLSSHESRESRFDDVLKLCKRLDFERTKAALLEHLANQPAQRPAFKTWDKSDASNAISELSSYDREDYHAQLHRAFRQINIVNIVQERMEAGITPSNGSGKHVAHHLIILENLARTDPNGVTEKKKAKLEEEYEAAYKAGNKWLEVVGYFGGVGIVFLSITREIGHHFAGAIWTKLHRQYVGQISQHLYSIKKLVQLLGEDALDLYCMNGNLPDELREKIEGLAAYD